MYAGLARSLMQKQDRLPSSFVYTNVYSLEKFSSIKKQLKAANDDVFHENSDSLSNA